MCAKIGRNVPLGRGVKVKTFHNPPQGDNRVLYIHPAKQEVTFYPSNLTGRPYGLLPVGVAALVNVLRVNGIQVTGINLPLEKQLNPSFSLRNWLRNKQNVRVVLIDLHWYEHALGALSVARLCKEVMPWAWTVLGGLTASGFSGEILEQFPEVDFIVRGDAEKPLLTLTKSLLSGKQMTDLSPFLVDIGNISYRDGNAIIENDLTYTATTEDLDTFDFINIDFLEHYQQYYIHEYIVTDLDKARRALETKPFWGKWTCTARGCKYECSYCGGCKSAHKTLAGRDGLVIRSPNKVVEDLILMVKLGIIQASLSYDISELGEDYWREFFIDLRSSGVKIGLYNEQFQLPEPEFLQQFFSVADQAHSCVALSPLSGSEKVRRINGKHFSNNQLFDTLEILNQNNAYVVVYFSLNLPGENETTFQETIRLAQDIYDFYPSSLLKIINSAHTIDPLSPMNVHPDNYGIRSSMVSFMDYYDYCRETQLMKPEARSEWLRGFNTQESHIRSVEAMANAWDEAGRGRENCWWPVPPSW